MSRIYHHDLEKREDLRKCSLLVTVSLLWHVALGSLVRHHTTPLSAFQNHHGIKTIKIGMNWMSDKFAVIDFRCWFFYTLELFFSQKSIWFVTWNCSSPFFLNFNIKWQSSNVKLSIILQLFKFQIQTSCYFRTEHAVTKFQARIRNANSAKNYFDL